MFLENDDHMSEEDFATAIMDIIQLHDAKKKKKKADTANLFILPVSRRPFFPGMAAPMVLDPGPTYDLIKTISKSENKKVGIVMTRDEKTDLNKVVPGDLYDVGVSATILRVMPQESGGATVIFTMERRILLKKTQCEGPFIKAKVKYLNDINGDLETLKPYAISIMTTIKELIKLNPLFKEELQLFLAATDFTEPGKLADFGTALTTADRKEWQAVLEALVVQDRLELALLLLRKELDISQLQFNINQKIDSSISKNQKEYFLREQLKTIKRELGIEKDDKSIEKEKIEERLKTRTVSPDVMKVINEELEKFSSLEPHSSEFGVTRNYLDWLTAIPWGVQSVDEHTLSKAEAVLAEDHYGLKDIKERIIEFIGVGKLSGGVKGSIICLIGPPGVGKTSIGKSIARALGRKFYRFSVGGMRDEAEIKGHRRTYIGAMPGKIIQALKTCETMNPVIMIDEVDKIGHSHNGDPASALLEVLDPEQNKEFLDHYLDVRADLSGVLFVLTANVLDTIPEPLKDRMDILRLSGYIMEEKIEIAQKFLVPKNMTAMGLTSKQLIITEDALKGIINGYAREAGVRNLENQLKKIMRKVAVEIVRHDQDESVKKKAPKKRTIDGKNLKDYLGKPVFTTDRFYENTPIGVCTGLAWTSMGGATLYIESTKVPSDKCQMKLTGQAGSVMKESSEIAWTYLQSVSEKYAPGIPFFKKSQVHIHIPEGSTPKDGPSAGITMVTSLLSLLKNVPVLENLGMTGELTLTGRVLPIGGVKEKMVASRRSGLKTLILPKDNLRDYDELPDYIKKGLTIHFVEHYDEVYKIAFQE